MTTPLWLKSDSVVHPEAMRFMSGDDIVLDRDLFPFDIEATTAHVRGLGAIEALSDIQVGALTEALRTLRAAFDAGSFILDEPHEDGHSAIEAYLVERLGELGERVHLGRSRNDQVLVATRLYLRHALAGVESHLLEAVDVLLELARTHEHLPMPGYTHLQRAVPSSVGLWLASFIEAFLDDVDLVRMTSRWMNRSPLGTAAGYGVNLPLPRTSVADELGFDGIVVNPMHAQAGRGKIEVQALTTLWQVAQDVRRLSWDLSLFTTAEFGFVSLPKWATTGSSIMPNKRNPDLAELLRGGAAVVGGCLAELQQLVSLPSGYHRDLQLTKGPLVRGVRAVRDGLALVPALLDGLEFDAERMLGAIDAPMLATDRAVELTTDGMSFRSAYRTVGESLPTLATETLPPLVDASLQTRTSPGACGDLMLDALAARRAEGAALRVEAKATS